MLAQKEPIGMLDLLIELEETFSIKIEEELREPLLTVQDIYLYVLKNSPVYRPESNCLTSKVFYRLRRALRSLEPSTAVKPNTLTTSLLPISGRRTFWNKLQRETKLRLPKLSLPIWISNLSLVLIAAIGIVTFIATYALYQSNSFSFWISLSSASATAILIHFMTLPLATHPAKCCETIRGLCESTLTRHFVELANENGGANRSDIWIVLKTILVTQLGTEPEKIVPSAQLVRDLGYE